MLTNAMRRAREALGAAILSFAHVASAGGLLGMDHRLDFDNDGIWARRQQHRILGTMLTGELLLGLWEGGGTRLGRTDWQPLTPR